MWNSFCVVSDAIEPIIVKEGDECRLECSSNRNCVVEWHRGDVIIYVTPGSITENFQRSVKVEPATGGEYNLIILHATESDTGLYRCIDNDGFGPVIKYIQLFVQNETSKGILWRHVWQLLKHCYLQ